MDAMALRQRIDRCGSQSDSHQWKEFDSMTGEMLLTSIVGDRYPTSRMLAG
jgi:hypothetical protein